MKVEAHLKESQLFEVKRLVNNARSALNEARYVTTDEKVEAKLRGVENELLTVSGELTQEAWHLRHGDAEPYMPCGMTLFRKYRPYHVNRFTSSCDRPFGHTGNHRGRRKTDEEVKHEQKLRK